MVIGKVYKHSMSTCVQPTASSSLRPPAYGLSAYSLEPRGPAHVAAHVAAHDLPAYSLEPRGPAHVAAHVAAHDLPAYSLEPRGPAHVAAHVAAHVSAAVARVRWEEPASPYGETYLFMNT
jgi:sulfur relay (sulfurtransferase) DsrC/TusE family protein